MTRLTRSERRALESRMANWQTPASLFQIADDEMSRIGSNTLFNQGGLDFIRNAWIAGEFGLLRQAGRARLIPQREQWPDFEIECKGGVERFEAVEAIDPNSRRGDEYKNEIGVNKHDPVEDWINEDRARTWIEKACQNKIAKRYAVVADLIVYLSANEYGNCQAAIENGFVLSTVIAKDCFKNIWVLWKDRAYHIWKDGRYRGVKVGRLVRPAVTPLMI